MKNLILGTLTLLFITSCSSNDDGYDNEPNTKQTFDEIRLNATIASSTSVRNSINGPIDNDFTTDIPIGIYAYGTTWLAGNNANIINNDEAHIEAAAGHAIIFDRGPYYYPSDGSDVHFFAFSPNGQETTPAGAGTSPIVAIPITGLEDVMWASATGHKVGSSAASNPSLNFIHKLTQLQFTLKSDPSYPASGNKVTSLIVKNQPNAVIMNVETGSCTYSGNNDMQAFWSTEHKAGIEITAEGKNPNAPIITSPNTSYTLDIKVKVGTTEIEYNNVPLSLTSLTGKAHMVTLTFTGSAITASATIAPWEKGSGGNVTIL